MIGKDSIVVSLIHHSPEIGFSIMVARLAWGQRLHRQLAMPIFARGERLFSAAALGMGMQILFQEQGNPWGQMAAVQVKGIQGRGGGSVAG